ncbi:hypothetical protein [Agaribacter flavus]|uniref:Uncharacterized protein n=1 Tax=Agaribacter flavus TaxID=1902781 RepID=A0ABV7FTK9_9ALTE
MASTAFVRYFVFLIFIIYQAIVSGKLFAYSSQSTNEPETPFGIWLFKKDSPKSTIDVSVLVRDGKWEAIIDGRPALVEQNGEDIRGLTGCHSYSQNTRLS